MMDSIKLLEEIKQLLDQNPLLKEDKLQTKLQEVCNDLKQEQQAEEQAILKLKKIHQLLELKFYVDSYQRSYKWTKHQVQALLEDINDFECTQQQNFYCLQPIVIKKRQVNNEAYLELIDGQQRMTTIYIILSYLQKNNSFSLEYQTRKESAEFLRNQIIQVKDYTEQSYSDFIQKYPQFDNIDNFHFFNAYQCVQTWFQKKQQSQPNIRQDWLNKLLNHTQVIWYQVPNKATELDEKAQAIQIFQRLNQGKISLTNAELIKALFLNALELETTTENLKIRQSEMANQWDLMEHTLQNPDFWAFVCPHQQNNIYTRIELIFDLLSRKNTLITKSSTEEKLKKNQEYYTFNYYAELVETKNGSVLNLWKSVQQGFYRLSEWFSNDEIYHLVGFIVGQKIKSITELWEISIDQDCSRSQFHTKLKNIIAEHICKNFDEKFPLQNSLIFENLNYGENSKIMSLMLLISIDLHRKQRTRFSFKSYYASGIQWSLEHIHAQNSKEQDDQNLDHWYAEQLDVLKHITTDDLTPLYKQELEQALVDWNTARNDANRMFYIELQEKYLKHFFERQKHQLDNLCLLNKNDNSALGNMLFFEKRQKVINLHKNEDTFIPIATQWVFAKYFNAQAENFTIWSQQDRTIYRQALINCWEYYQTDLFEVNTVGGKEA